MKQNCRFLPASLLLAISLLVGCTSSPPVQDHRYLLRPEKLMASSPDESSAVLLNPVLVAQYLDRQGIVLETGSSEIHVAKHHRWAEALDEAVERYLQVSIANRAGVVVESTLLTTDAAAARVTVRINQMHGTDSGRVRLVADWKVDHPDQDATLFSFDESVSQGADGYPALVAAHAVLLDNLGAAIADSLAAGQQ